MILVVFLRHKVPYLCNWPHWNGEPKARTIILFSILSYLWPVLSMFLWNPKPATNPKMASFHIIDLLWPLQEFPPPSSQSSPVHLRVGDFRFWTILSGCTTWVFLYYVFPILFKMKFQTFSTQKRVHLICWIRWRAHSLDNQILLHSDHPWLQPNCPPSWFIGFIHMTTF